MEEERLLILRMIAEGKITAEEGAALLDALKDGASSPLDAGVSEEHLDTGRSGEEAHSGPRFEKVSDSDLTKRLEDEAGKFAENVQGAAEKFSRLLEERIEKDVKPALANMPAFFSQLPFVGSWFGPTVTVEEEHSGELLGEDIDVHYEGRNGHLEVVMWDESGYRIEAQKMLKGAVNEETRNADALVVDVQPGRLEARVKTGIPVGVNTRLYLPRNRAYRLHLRSTNGWIRVQEVAGDLVEALTSNGRIEIRRAKAEQIVLRTSNGAIECEGVSAKELQATTSNGRISAQTDAPDVHCHTSNGSIYVRPMATSSVELSGDSKYDLGTSNGSIKVGIPRELLAVTSVDAKTSFGAIKIESDLLQLKLREDKVGDKHVVAQGSAFEDSERKLRVHAKTNNSSVTISEG